MFRKSLQHRLLAAFLLIGTIPYLFIMLYFSYWGRSSIIEEQRARYLHQATQSRQLIQSRLEQLKREVSFLSQLEIFDDMIAMDVDHRISRLLKLRSELGEDSPLIMHAVGLNGKIVASSQAMMLQKEYAIDQNIDAISHHIEQRCLIITLPLKASFDDRLLGQLSVRYPIENLKRLMIGEASSDYAIVSGKELIYGSASEIARSTIGLDGLLEGYSLLYSIDETDLLSFTDDFMLYFTLSLLLGMTMIYFVSRHLTQQIIQPVTALKEAAKKIITTQDYTLRVNSDSIDETGSLANMFDRLVATTGDALDRLSDENQLRMQRFIDLTDMFNHITQIDDEEDCIDVSMTKLHSVMPYSTYFIPSDAAIPPRGVSVPLYLNDITTKEHVIYGHLVIEKEHFDDELEERFFISVGAMIMLQIERISLINKIQGASEAKSTFISGMSHELRTPLNAIIGFSQYLIAYETLNDEQMDTVGKIEKAALHLLHMINDILDIAKIEAGKMEVSLSDVKIAPLLKECTDILTPLADEKALPLELKIDAVQDVILTTDAKLCKQIIINLLSNAIKFTDSGSVRLDASVKEGKVIISITDSGVGIGADDLLKVFDAFTQLKETRRVRYKGTGLGLSLSRHIAHSIGAELTLQSEGRGLGTVARLTFKTNEMIDSEATL